MAGRAERQVDQIRVADDRFQVLRSLLGNRAKRRRQGLAVVQGVRPIRIALEQGWEVDAFLTRAGRRLSTWAVDAMAARDSNRVEVAAELFDELAERDEPGELLAVVRIRTAGLADVPLGDDLLVVACDRPTSPGNLGAVIRSADAFGAGAVVISGHGADPFDPQAVRASTGSVFAVPVVEVPGFGDVAAWASSAGARLVAADEAGAPLAGAPLDGPVVVAVGNEGRGLGRAALQRCDTVVAIPMRGAASSLNVANAASIVLYEVDRRRRANGP